jgi:uncharacterized protein (UPF0332 family)
MDFRDFLTVASDLATGTTEAEWRSAVSRAYYAAFHVGCQLLRGLGFAVPRADRAHAYLWLRLSNSGDPDVRSAGLDLNDLRRQRNQADYDAHRPIGQAEADNLVVIARVIIQALDAAAREPTRTQITNAMVIYERDVLRDVTWHP